jgi:hypothetical protein
MLSQSLTVVFNKCAEFKSSFVAILKRRSPLIDQSAIARDVEHLRMKSQQSKQIIVGRRIVDLELYHKNYAKSIAFLEVKLESLLGQKQLDDYVQYVIRRRKGHKAVLVILSKYKIDPELISRAPSNTVWLSWAEVYSLCVHTLKMSSIYEKLILQEFIEMLSERGIDFVPELKKSELQRMLNFHRTRTGRLWWAYESNINIIAAVLARLSAFRDNAWQSLKKEKGGKWYPYTFVAVDDGILECMAIFQRPVPKMYPQIQLVCRLEQNRSRKRISLSIEASRHNYEEIELYVKYDQKQTVAFFSKELSEAIDDIRMPMAKALAKFKRSKIYRGK